MARLVFLGAAETVTGSKYLIECGDHRVLVDCGLFQGYKSLRQKNWEPLPIEADTIDAVVLTHAHLDHVGYLPRLVKDGFYGLVHCTPATQKLARLILLDSAKNQEHDAAYANKKGFSKHKPALPLYDSRDAEEALALVDDVARDTWFNPAGDIWMRYHDAGHLLGSNIIEVELRHINPPVRILFSGDVGNYGGPLYHDPVPPPRCDYLICESTYGNRDHPAVNVIDSLKEIVERAVARGGVMVVASFAVGRAQQLIYLLHVLKDRGEIPDLPIYLDSPMSINATNIYRAHRGDHDLSERALDAKRPVLGGPNCFFTRTTEESKALNEIHSRAIIIASSGMMIGGRILHHLKRRLPDRRNTIVPAGFQAAGTRGRHLLEGAKTLRIYGRDIPVAAAVEAIDGLSGHADRSGLLRWLEPLPAPQRVFLTHGELDSANAFAETLRTDRGWTCHVPKMGEAFDM